MEGYFFVDSLTGNTKMLEDVIKKYVNKTDDLNTKTYFIGSWCDKGTMSKKCLDFLDGVKNKDIFLFLTCGFGIDDEYFNKVYQNVLTHVDKSNNVIGHFICAGKLQEKTLIKYQNILKEDKDNKFASQLVKNYFLVKDSPTEKDLKKLEEIIKCII